MFGLTFAEANSVDGPVAIMVFTTMGWALGLMVVALILQVTKGKKNLRVEWLAHVLFKWSFRILGAVLFGAAYLSGIWEIFAIIGAVGLFFYFAANHFPLPALERWPHRGIGKDAK